MPVPGGPAWGIEAGRVVEPKDVLARDDAEVGPAGHGQLYEIPGHLGTTVAEIITDRVFLFFRQASPPAQGRIIVVSPGVDHAVGGVVFREVWVVRP